MSWSADGANNLLALRYFYFEQMYKQRFEKQLSLLTAAYLPQKNGCFPVDVAEFQRFLNYEKMSMVVAAERYCSFSNC